MCYNLCVCVWMGEWVGRMQTLCFVFIRHLMQTNGQFCTGSYQSKQPIITNNIIACKQAAVKVKTFVAFYSG